MTINIAIAADKNMEVGLHTTLYSALNFMGEEIFTIFHLFLTDYNDVEIQRIRQTLSEFDGRYKIELYDNGSLDLGRKNFHFNNTCNVILRAPEKVNADKLLYLDADLLILTNVGKIFEFSLDGKTSAAVRETTIGWSSEKDFFNSLAMPDSTAYFNSGVMLFDTKLWREKMLTQKSFSFFEKHHKFIRGDQTILNGVLRDDIAVLPERYNTMYSPGDDALDLDMQKDCICHFFGSPKPWDIFGELLHNSYPAFSVFLKKTYFAKYKSYRNIRAAHLFRTACLIRSYSRVLKNKFK